MRKTSLLCLPVLAMLAGCGGYSFSNTMAGQWLRRDVSAQTVEVDGQVTRIAFGSCADESKPQPIWTAIAAQNPDIFLHLGDIVYADIQDTVRLKEGSVEAIKRSYEMLSRVPEFTAFRQSVPLMVIWDDHDMGLNDAGAEFPFKQESKDVMLDFFGVAVDAPVRSHDGVYHSRIIGQQGQRVQVIMLDTRWFRSPLKKTDDWGAKGKERYLPDADASKTMLGEAQWVWLKQELQKPADLRLLVSSMQVLADGHGWEAWRNLPTEREKLYRMINESGAEGVVILSGDRHVGGLYERKGITSYPIYEATSSSINVAFIDFPDEVGPYQIGRLFGPENFGMVEVDWAARTVSLNLRNMDGANVNGVTLRLDDLKPLPPQE